jgi:hypothetical protein
MPVQLKVAVLELLAKRPDGRATLDELAHEMKTAADGLATVARLSELDDVDIFQSGLVVSAGHALQITDAGRSVLHALKQLSKTEAESNSGDRPHALQRIDALIGTKQRQKIFDLGLRGARDGPTLEPLADEQELEPEAVQTEAEANVGDEAGTIAQIEQETVPQSQEETVPQSEKETAAQIDGDTADAHDLDQGSELHAPSSRPLGTPAFLTRDLSSKAPVRTVPRGPNLSASIGSGLARVGGILRGHVEQDVSRFKGKDRAAGARGALLAGLSLLVILIGAGALVAINQIKSLKTEIATLERALPNKKQAAKSEPVEGRKDDQRDDRGKTSTDKASGAAPIRAAVSGLSLSPEEIHLVRDYIKPAPSVGPATLPSITVGDSVTTGTIALPSPLTDKIPTLKGGRFTIRNGAIVILKRDSHQADAVLPPN